MSSRPNGPASSPEPLIGMAEVARLLDVPLGTLRTWRGKRTGPPGYRIGRAVKYRWSEVEKWLQQQKDPEPTAARALHDLERFGRVGLGEHRRRQ